MNSFPRLAFFPFSALIASALLCACASNGHGSNASTPTLTDTRESGNSGFGRIEAIEVSKIPGSDDIGMGSVIGGVIGGILSNQIGGGNGKILATVAGMGGGAIVGNRVEQFNRLHETYRIRVQLDNGDLQTVSQDNDADLSVGNRVHIDNGHVYRY
jgi:outer membrane lipoprotein SlyB